jgi:predicted MFS family arabinose efflux permease
VKFDFSRYRALLVVPRARPLVLGATLSRQSAMLLLAQVLLVREATNSYAAAGAATAALTLAQALSAPYWGRRIDRDGPRRIVGALALLDGAALLALVLASESGATPGALIALAGTVGVLGPPTVPAMRTMWSRLLADGSERQAAYALEAALTELAFVSGPLATAILVTIVSPAAAVLTGAAFLVGGSLLFAFAAPDHGGVGPEPHSLGWLGALRSPGIRLLIGVWVPLGASFTALDIVVPAFCQRAGATGLAGVLLAATATGAVVGGLFYGALPPPASMSRRFRWACLAFGLALIPLAASTGVAMLAVLLLAAGLTFSPIATLTSQWIDDFAADGRATESFTWLLTAYLAGGALGAQVAGLAVNGFGCGLAMAIPSVFAVVVAICAVIGTRQLRRVRVRSPAPMAARPSAVS